MAPRCGSTRCADKAVQSAPAPSWGGRTRTSLTSASPTGARGPLGLGTTFEGARRLLWRSFNSVWGRRGYHARGRTWAHAGLKMRPVHLGYPPGRAGALAWHVVTPDWRRGRCQVLTRHLGLELRVAFEAFTLAQPERGPHCHGGGLGTGVEADDAVRRRRTSRGRWRWRKRLTRAAAAAASPHTSTTAAPGAARAAPQQYPSHPPACVSACVSNVPAPAAPSAPLRAASCCHLRCSHSVD